jgi:hypothetical protein
MQNGQVMYANVRSYTQLADDGLLLLEPRVHMLKSANMIWFSSMMEGHDEFGIILRGSGRSCSVFLSFTASCQTPRFMVLAALSAIVSSYLGPWPSLADAHEGVRAAAVRSMAAVASIV